MTIVSDKAVDLAVGQLPPHLLVVDDARDNAHLLCQLLDMHGYTTSVAFNGNSALTRVAQQAPDLILLDLMLPDIDGYEVTRRIRANQSLPFIPILLVTARTAAADKLQGLEAGVDDVLTKPINRHELMVRVKVLLHLKQAQDELRANQARLRQIEQAHEQMLHLLFHDMRTPLAGAMSCLELLSRAPKQSDDERELIALALDACRTQDEMIGDLLVLQRAETNQLTLDRDLIDLTAIVRAAVAQVAGRVRQKQLALRVMLPPSLPISADAVKLERVLVILLHNALKYAPKGGNIIVSGHYEPAKGRVQLSVEDDGHTLPTDRLPHVFDRRHLPAAMAHNTRRSIGAGLAFCHAIVALHGGTAWAETPTRGLRIVLSLPVGECSANTCEASR